MYRSAALVVYLIMLLICMGAAYDQPDQTVYSNSVVLDAVLNPSIQISQIQIKSLGSDCQMVIIGQANCDVSIAVQDAAQTRRLNEQKAYIVYYHHEGSFLKRIEHHSDDGQSKNLKIIITSLI